MAMRNEALSVGDCSDDMAEQLQECILENDPRNLQNNFSKNV